MQRFHFVNSALRWGAVACLAGVLFGESLCVADEVITLAGTGKEGYSAKTQPGTQAALGGPFGLAIAPDRSLYVCETTNHVIRRINEKTGLISTIIGRGGETGFAGDGGQGITALLGEPYEIRFDGNGNMYFVDMKSNVVRRVDAKSRLLSTIVGNNKQGDEGDGGPGKQASLSMPHSIAMDNDRNMYICDIGNHKVRRFNMLTGVIDTYAGTGRRGREPIADGAPRLGTPLNGPRALDFDGDHSLYLAMREGNSVYRIDLKTETLHHFAGTGKKGYTGDGGDAKQSMLSGPKGVAIGPGGDVYLADTENHVIRVVHQDSGIIETLVGDGQAGDGPDGDPRKCRLNRPHGVFVDKQGNVYIGDSLNHRVRKLVRTAGK